MQEQYNAPLSPIVDGYANSMNSPNVEEGFITSTPSGKENKKSPSILRKRVYRVKPTNGRLIIYDQKYIALLTFA